MKSGGETDSPDPRRSAKTDKWMLKKNLFTLGRNRSSKKTDSPPQDVVAADGAEGPEEDSGSRSNKELGKVMGTEEGEKSGRF